MNKNKTATTLEKQPLHLSTANTFQDNLKQSLFLVCVALYNIVWQVESGALVESLFSMQIMGSLSNLLATPANIRFLPTSKEISNFT